MFRFVSAICFALAFAWGAPHAEASMMVTQSLDSNDAIHTLDGQHPISDTTPDSDESELHQGQTDSDMGTAAASGNAVASASLIGSSPLSFELVDQRELVSCHYQPYPFAEHIRRLFRPPRV